MFSKIDVEQLDWSENLICHLIYALGVMEESILKVSKDF
jgi:hypothetical protein